MTGVQTPMSGRIHPDEVSLNKTVGPYQLRVRWGGYAVSDPALWPPQRDGREKSFSLEGSIKNHINIHDVYQSKSGSGVCSASLILSLSAVLEKLWICKALTALLFFFFLFQKPIYQGNQLERLTSVGSDRQLQPSGSEEWERERRARGARARPGLPAAEVWNSSESGALEEESRKHLKRHKGQNSRVMNRDEKMPPG